MSNDGSCPYQAFISREAFFMSRSKHSLSTSCGPNATYSAWKDMRQRCGNKNSKDYAGYGGRGITICSDWSDFLAFLRDMGPKPPGLTLDRIDNNKGYCKDNCRWATPAEQRRNTRDTKLTVEQARQIRIDERSLREIANEYGISRSHASRIRRGFYWKELPA